MSAMRARKARTRLMLIAAATCGAAACGDSVPTGPAAEPPPALFVLNSTGQTLMSLSVGSELRAAQSIDLGPAFDGDGIDLDGEIAVSTISSFGGSRIVWVDTGEGSVRTAGFPEPDAELVNPSRPTFDRQGQVWVGGRHSDAVYRISPGETQATLVAAAVGEFVERVVPVEDELWAVDANLDDDGFTFQPLGPSRIVVLSRDGAPLRTIELPPEVPNARDALHVGSRVIVMAAGALDPITFVPRGNGALIVMDAADGTVTTIAPLEGNGVALERGSDGNVYVTRTVDFVHLDVLRFDPGAEVFERGPGDPIRVRDSAGSVDCWVATALADGRLLCATFSFAEPGRVLLTDPGGRVLAETPGGFGTTDLHLVP